MDQHEPAPGETADDLVDHPLAAEEDRPFVFLERTQARIGPVGQLDGDRRGGSQGAAPAGALREASSHERNRPRQSV